MRRSRKATLAFVAALLGTIFAALPARADVPDCLENPLLCTPVFADEQGNILVALLERVGDVDGSYHWVYSPQNPLIYGFADSQGNFYEVGRVRVAASISLENRTSNWQQVITRSSGPAIRASHHWNCVDDNGWNPNSSCSGGWQSKHFSTYVNYSQLAQDTNHHAQNERYWYDFIYVWVPQSYPQTAWSWPNSFGGGNNLSSAVFTCDEGDIPCAF